LFLKIGESKKLAFIYQILNHAELFFIPLTLYKINILFIQGVQFIYLLQ